MRRALLIIATVSTVCLIGTLVLGFMVLGGSIRPQEHMNMALLAVSSSVAANVMSIVYVVRDPRKKQKAA